MKPQKKLLYQFIHPKLLWACLLVVFFACTDDTDERNKFVGRYEVQEQSLVTYTQRDDYEVRIRKELASEDVVIITNFYNLDIDVRASVEGNTISVMRQTHNLFDFEGSGTLSGSLIKMDYAVYSAEQEDELIDHLRAEMTLID